jgi:hypothetical protein
LREILFALVLICFPIADVASAQEISDSCLGFDNQFQKVFRAYEADDQREFKLLADEFAIPAHWFAEVFGIDQGEMLAKQYADEFSDFVPHLLRNFESIDSLKAKHRLDKNTPTEIRTAPWSPRRAPTKAPEPQPASLLPLPRVDRFEIAAFMLIGRDFKPGLSWMDSFIYVDGKFRFFGRGSSSFWKPAKVRRADPCARPGQQTGGLIISRVEPVYPAEALNNHVEGFVKAVLIVEKNGTVKNVEIIEGDPLLVDAAKEAFMRWQYTPFMNCGRPVEMGSFEHVKFSLLQ